MRIVVGLSGGADSAAATGHYAVLTVRENGRYAVRPARDVRKDQSYMLYALTQEQLSRTLFPLGEHTKEEVRHMLSCAGLRVSTKSTPFNEDPLRWALR